MATRAVIEPSGTVTLTSDEGWEELEASNPEVGLAKIVKRMSAKATESGSPVQVSVVTPQGDTSVIEVDKTGNWVELDESGAEASPESSTDAEEVSFFSQPKPTAPSSGSYRAGGVGVMERVGPFLRTWPGRFAIGSLIVFLLVLGWALSRGGSDDDKGANNVSAPSADEVDNALKSGKAVGCLGGDDLDAGARQAMKLASTSTQMQGGRTVPSTVSAATAAVTFARFRSAMPASPDQAATVKEIVAPGADASARRVAEVKPGYKAGIDTTQARWRIVSGNAREAGIDMLLRSVATVNGTEAKPEDFRIHVDLKVVNGEWRLAKVGKPHSTDSDFRKSSYAYTLGCGL